MARFSSFRAPEHPEGTQLTSVNLIWRSGDLALACMDDKDRSSGTCKRQWTCQSAELNPLQAGF